MICLEVLINGQKVCVAGTDHENRISSDIYITPDSDIPRIFVAGDSYNEDRSWKQRFIFGQQDLKIGDEITIRVTDNIQPDEPIDTREVSYTKESEDIVNKIIRTTSELWLERLLSGEPIELKSKNESKKGKEKTESLYCSFCGKEKGEVKKLISGPSDVFICNECVELCTEIIEEKEEEKKEKEKPNARWPKRDDNN